MHAGHRLRSAASGKDNFVREPHLPRPFLARAATIAELLTETPSDSVSEERLQRAASDLARFSISLSEAAFDTFLEQRRLARQTLLRALAIHSIDRRQAGEQHWQHVLASVLSRDFLKHCDPQVLGSEGIRKPFYPLLTWCSQSIDEWQKTYRADWEALRPSLLRQISDELFAIGYKPLVLEVNVQSIQDAPPTQRNADEAVALFTRTCVSSSRFVQRFYLRYAALSRLLATKLLDWQRTTTTLLTNLQQDAPQIEALLAPEGLALLQHIESTLSDPHDGGKRVSILHFSDGRRIVHKPRSMAVDAQYGKLIEWLNVRSSSPAIRTLKVVVKSGYGWVEYAEPKGLDAEHAAHAFYERLGSHLALLYVTKSTDFHSENVIANGDQPILVDLETLMHADATFATQTFSRGPGAERLRDSVLACGLLPGWATVDMAAVGPDLSGIGARDGQFYKEPSDFLDAGEDGGIAVVHRRSPIKENPNRPTHEGRAMNPAFYAVDVMRGFESAYRVFAGAASELMQPAGPMHDLFDVVTRNVALATVLYVQMLGRANHPDFATRSIYRELCLANLAQRGVLFPSASTLLPFELDALFGGDVPKFSSFPQSTSLFDERGTEIRNVLAETPRSAVFRRIDKLSEEDLEIQLNIVRLGMTTVLRSGEPGTEVAPPFPIPSRVVPHKEIFAAVREIAYAVCDEAIVEHGRIDWIAIVQGDYEASRLSDAGGAMYDGAAGIGLFLAYAGRKLSDARLLNAANLCADTALEYFGYERGLIGGAYIGRCSAGYGLLHMATVLDRPEIVDHVCARLPEFSLAMKSDRYFDIIAGSAGYIAVALAAHTLRQDELLLRAAVDVAEHLVASRISHEGYSVWPAREAKAPLTGFSHGAAGIGWALRNLGERAERADFVAAGIEAFEYERSLYVESHGWPDFRNFVNATEGTTPRCSSAWCHGAPGIGLSRATLVPIAIGQTDLDDVNRALEALLRSSLAPTDCLCHGELGNLELLLSAGHSGQRSKLFEIARYRASAALLRRRQRKAWRCGGIPDTSTPGLLCGLAGIGYGLLRCFCPDDFPAVLAIAQPIA